MCSSTFTLRTSPFPMQGVSGKYHVLKIPVCNANSVDPDQTPRFAASDLGLHCLSMSLLWGIRLKWINGRVNEIVLTGPDLSNVWGHICLVRPVCLYALDNYSTFNVIFQFV